MGRRGRRGEGCCVSCAPAAPCGVGVSVTEGGRGSASPCTEGARWRPVAGGQRASAEPTRGPHEATSQETQDDKLIVEMLRHYARTPSTWCDGGPFYPVWWAA